MLLEKITLENWRCFYGEQKIEFASTTDRNVTLIHAENGVGKTSLLNALLWCFYKKHTPRFEKPDDILNLQALREGKTSAYVAVEFSHEDNLYEARRFFRRGISAAQDTLKVTKIFNDGTQEHVRNDPNLFLNSVLPADMAGHFLFDGEHAEAITGRANSSTVSKAIKDILGCSFVVQTIEALAPIETSYRRSMSTQTTIDRMSELESALKRNQNAAKNLNNQVEKIDNLVAEMEEERAGIENTLSQFANIKQAQTTKTNLITTIAREQKYQKHSLVTQQIWAGNNATYVTAKNLLPFAQKVLAEFNANDAKKTKFNKEVINQILSLGECVCGTQVESNAGLKQHLIGQLETAESLELKNRINKVKSLFGKLEKYDEKSAIEDFHTSKQRYTEHDDTIKTSEISLTEVTRAIENADVDSIAKLQLRSSELYKHILNQKQNKGEILIKIRAANAQIPKLQAQLNSLSATSSDDQDLRQNLELAQSVRKFLTDRLDSEINTARRIINSFVRDIIEKTARKDFKVIVDKSFTVLLKDKYDQDMPKSEGENQLLGLAFTGALAKFAKLRKNASGKILLPGTEAPLVLDAPFGKLDTVYKHATAEFLPEMASQVIVMVNKEQGSERVLNLLEDRIGFQYALVRHNTSPQNDKATEHLSIKGRSLQITNYDSAFDGTSIEVI